MQRKEKTQLITMKKTTKSKKNKATAKHNKHELTKAIFAVLNEHPNESFNYKQIAAKLQITDATKRDTLIKRLAKLKEKKQIIETDRGKYRAIEMQHYYVGTLDINSRGNGYVMVDDLEDDIFVPSNFLNKALHGDLVEVYVFPRFRNRQKMEGEITKILERNKVRFVGTVQLHKNFAFVIPTDHRMYTDIFVFKENLSGATDGDRVLVRIEEWKDKSDSPTGVVEQVLGKPGEQNTEMHSILAEYGLPYTYPEEVDTYAKALDVTITEEEIAKRRDMREVLTFTIDPKDAKDFDDALSFRVLENGNYEVGVHIADVSHYVKEGTILDEEAYNRATSVYLVDRVVPMLPEVLSNFACSLRPNEDKYTFSAIFEMNGKAEIVNQWIGRTVIHSSQRFAYEEAQAIIEEGSVGEHYTLQPELSITNSERTIPSEIVDAVLTLNTLAQVLRHKRMQRGAISFDKIEVKFQLDENDNPIGVYFKESKEANKLIEEFMLLANRRVAEFVSKMKKTFVYRVHDEPDAEKLEQLNGVISRFGYAINLQNKNTITHSLNTLLEEVKGKKEQNLVDTLAIRSMAKAAYSTKNIGHYGLAFDDYTHFTSPIRRYPDIMVHRLLQLYLDNAPSQNESDYEVKCKHSSQMETLASSAERDSIKYMQVKYMEAHTNQQFAGVISGITEWGIYVEIVVNKCEGLVRARDLKDDYYSFDEQQYALVGRATGKMYQLGDEVMVRVKNTDLMKKQLDFEIIN